MIHLALAQHSDNTIFNMAPVIVWVVEGIIEFDCQNIINNTNTADDDATNYRHQLTTHHEAISSFLHNNGNVCFPNMAGPTERHGVRENIMDPTANNEVQHHHHHRHCHRRCWRRQTAERPSTSSTPSTANDCDEDEDETERKSNSR